MLKLEILNELKLSVNSIRTSINELTRVSQGVWRSHKPKLKVLNVVYISPHHNSLFTTDDDLLTEEDINDYLTNIFNDLLDYRSTTFIAELRYIASYMREIQLFNNSSIRLRLIIESIDKNKSN